MSSQTLPSSIRQSNGKLEIVNQLALPHVTEYVAVESIEDAYNAIKSMKIRGAPAIASLASLAISYHLETALKESPEPSFLLSTDTLADHLETHLSHLYTARPTAVNLSVAIRRLRRVVEENRKSSQPRQLAQNVIDEARRINDEDVGRNKKMSELGAQWLLKEIGDKKNGSGGLNVLTICNTGSLATSGYGTAIGLITYLHENGHLNRAYFTQSTPYHQGSRLTAYEFKQLGIPSTMICDTMVGSLFQNHDIHAVVVGADRVALNGDTANKIGTYNAAVLARRHGVLFIVVAPESTVDLDTLDGSHIPIEHRPAIEACMARGVATPRGSKPIQATVLITPEEIDVYNPSFDITPEELISAIVTERGVATKATSSNTFDLQGLLGET